MTIEKAELENDSRPMTARARSPERRMEAEQSARPRRMFLEPAFRPLGWDWKTGMAALASFPAREVIVGTLGSIYDVGDVDTGATATTRPTMRRRKRPRDWPRRSRTTGRRPDARQVRRGGRAVGDGVFRPLLSVRLDAGGDPPRDASWAWPAFTFAYMTALAYLGAMVAFQVGVLITDATG